MNEPAAWQVKAKKMSIPGNTIFGCFSFRFTRAREVSTSSGFCFRIVSGFEASGSRVPAMQFNAEKVDSIPTDLVFLMTAIGR